MKEKLWLSLYDELLDFLNKIGFKGSFKFKDKSVQKTFEELREKFRDEFVNYIVNGELVKAQYWIRQFKRSLEEVMDKLRIEGVFLSKELNSFIRDPKEHLKKKIFNYTYDLLRGKMDVIDFERRAGAAVRTSFRTNLRSIYQDWAFLTILSLLSEEGRFKVVFPEHMYLHLERFGKQKSRTIPPNIILEDPLGRCLSFFLEAPRPLGWEDSLDLKEIWNFYTALRPDLLVYTTKVLDIVDIGRDPPIKRPDAILEFKELEDWYVRSRDVKGPLAKPLTAEEWRSRWIEGLWDGLAEVLGVERETVIERVKEKKGLRISEVKVITLYKTFYKPNTMFLISRSKVPEQIVHDLEGYGIEVVDNVEFNKDTLRGVAKTLITMCKPTLRNTVKVMLSIEAYEKIRKIAEILKVSEKEVLERIVEEAFRRYVNS